MALSCRKIIVGSCHPNTTGCCGFYGLSFLDDKVGITITTLFWGRFLLPANMCKLGNSETFHICRWCSQKHGWWFINSSQCSVHHCCKNWRTYGYGSKQETLLFTSKSVTCSCAHVPPAIVQRGEILLSHGFSDETPRMGPKNPHGLWCKTIDLLQEPQNPLHPGKKKTPQWIRGSAFPSGPGCRKNVCVDRSGSYVFFWISKVVFHITIIVDIFLMDSHRSSGSFTIPPAPAGSLRAFPGRRSSSSFIFSLWTLP